MVTEYMSKGSLFDILHPEVPSHDSMKLAGSWSLKVKVMKDIARGMEFLHMKNIIHRDLKVNTSPHSRKVFQCHNLLVDMNWTTKVADFGISRVKELTGAMSKGGSQ